MSYGHGGDVYTNAGIFLDYSINLNPLGMPKEVQEAAREAIVRFPGYPDSGCHELKRAVARYYQVPEECLLAGNGASELIYQIVRARRPKKAALLAPTFSEYEKALSQCGCELRFFYIDGRNGEDQTGNRAIRQTAESCTGGKTAEKDFLSGYLAFLERERPEMIFLCNPSNPLGTALSRSALEDILGFCGEVGILAVVDECFLEFLSDWRDRTCISQVRNGNKNIFVLQAPTKTFSMAGLRLGYGFLANEELYREMEEMDQPWSVSAPAQKAGASTFGSWRESFLGETRAFLEKERPFLEKGLADLGFTPFSSAANFITFRDNTGRDENELYDFMKKRGILIRACQNFRGLDGRHYRICVKDHQSNEKFLQYLQQYL